MFTGLVDDVGIIDRVADTSAGREFVIRSRYDDLVDGESIAVNGACLTVRDRADGRFSVAAVVTTLGRTAIGGWAEGKRVNLGSFASSFASLFRERAWTEPQTASSLATGPTGR